MRSNNGAVLLAIILALTACGSGGGGPAAVVSSPSPVSMTVTPADPSLPAGSIMQLNVIGTYADKSTKDLTASALWSSSATGVAAIGTAPGSKGTVVSIAAGTTVITAAMSGVSGSTTLTVAAPTA